MKDKKSFKDLVSQMESLQENHQGKLKGGFSSYSTFAAYKQKDNSNSVSVSVGGDPCSCNCACGEP